MSGPGDGARDAEAWEYAADGNDGWVRHAGREIRTHYPREIVELLVRRKGARRMMEYLRYTDERGPLLEPLFRRFEAEGRTVKVLEPGCSAGHIAEAILRHPCVERLVSFDADPQMVEICRAKARLLGLTRWDVAHASTPAFTDERFDLVLLFAVMEHVDPALRRAMIDQCYERLRPGGFLVVLDSPNRRWPFEYHTLRLPIPYVQYLPPRAIFRLGRLLGRFGPDDRADVLADPNTGWWGTTIAEIRPSRGTVTDVSEEFGYGAVRHRRSLRAKGWVGRLKAALFGAAAAPARLLGTSPSALAPSLYVAYRKE